jgi:ribose/xylose/arabinose/galactoside ABC-type transport system permease subunit
MIELLAAFIAPWIALLWAFYKLRDDPVWSIVVAVAGIMAGIAGVLVADATIQQLQNDCIVQSIIHNKTLPCGTPQAYRTLGFTSLIALTLNLIMFAVATMVYAVKLTQSRIEGIP